eukprot:scaffold427948_cov16-Prasinocladus_malaysianus.AAC.1
MQTVPSSLFIKTACHSLVSLLVRARTTAQIANHSKPQQTQSTVFVFERATVRMTNDTVVAPCTRTSSSSYISTVSYIVVVLHGCAVINIFTIQVAPVTGFDYSMRQHHEAILMVQARSLAHLIGHKRPLAGTEYTLEQQSAEPPGPRPQAVQKSFV